MAMFKLVPLPSGRYEVLDPVTDAVMGSIVGADDTGFEARLPGGASLVTAEPLTTKESAAVLIALEFTMSLESAGGHP